MDSGPAAAGPGGPQVGNGREIQDVSRILESNLLEHVLVEQLLLAGRDTEALRRAEALVRGAPDDAEALCLLARAQVSSGHVAQAVRSSARAVALDPESDHALGVQALTLHLSGDCEAATASARAATRLNPHNWHAWVQLAMSGSDVPDARAEAWHAGLRAVEIAPGTATSHVAMGVAAMDVDPRTARRAFVEALRLDPEDSRALNNLALLDGRAGRIRAAADGFARAIGADPQEDIARKNLGLALISMLRTTHLVVAVTYIVLARVARELPAGGVASRVLGVVLLCAGLGAVLWVRHQARRAPAGVRRYAVTLLRRDRVVGAWALALTVAALCMLLALLGPASLQAPLVQWALAPLLVGVVLYFVGRRRWCRGET